MKTIILAFDTLVRNMLPNYGNHYVKAPNFEKLHRNFTQFNNCYCGSLPCIPARRDLHTGRYNFLHRNWGPFEPFDFSVFKFLRDNGTNTHLITDHWHYAEEGGFGYHNQYSSWELIRGAEGDPFSPCFEKLTNEYDNMYNQNGLLQNQYYCNKKALGDKSYTSLNVMKRAIDYLDKYHDKDNWLLHIECFSPHEPFDAPEKFKQLYDMDEKVERCNWPKYIQIDNIPDDVKKAYAANISYCDELLGLLLDRAETYNLWNDTLIIIHTDHGFMLGEHSWLGKNEGPQYEEISHIPLFIHFPKMECLSSEILVQTIDIAPTLLDYYNLPVNDSIIGKSILKMLKDNKGHDSIIYGIHGGHVNYVELPYVYMKASVRSDNQPLETYTLLPLKGNEAFSKNEFIDCELLNDIKYANGFPILKMAKRNRHDSYKYGDMLFNIADDPMELNNIKDKNMINLFNMKLYKKLSELEAPQSVLKRIFN